MSLHEQFSLKLPKRRKRTAARMLVFEEMLWGQGARLVAGVDEAGRGPLAGPVLAAAVVLRRQAQAGPIRDSKRLSARQRESAIEYIHQSAVAWSVARVDSDEIDRVNVLRATQIAMARAVEQLRLDIDFVLVDGTRPIVGLDLEQRALVRGDQRSATIAAASIIAKVTRDRIMRKLHDEYPGYGFDVHKGYGTPDHMRALRELGPCAIHRRTYAPVRELLESRLPLDE